MKKYIGLLIPLILYAISDYLQSKKDTGYSKEEKISNLEKAREAKKSKAILKDYEELNGPDLLEQNSI